MKQKAAPESPAVKERSAKTPAGRDKTCYHLVKEAILFYTDQSDQLRTSQ